MHLSTTKTVLIPLLLNLIASNVIVKGGNLTTIQDEIYEESSEAAPYFYKFIVALKDKGQVYCGGSLINPTTVLTAAHCSEGKPFEKQVSISRHDLSKSATQDNGIDIGVSKMVVHENYDLDTLRGDIALWKLSKPVPSNIKVNYVTLANNSQYFDLLLPKVTVLGWGYVDYSTEKAANKLQVASLKILTPQECSEKWNNEINMEGKICTLSPDGTQSVCNGDSGGPLFYVANSNNKIEFVQVGLVSFGEEKCRLNMHLPDGFTRISSYYSWIIDHVKTLEEEDRKKDSKAIKGVKKLWNSFKSIYNF